MNLPNFNIDEVMRAIIADEPDLANHQDSLHTALAQLKYGEFARTTIISQSAQMRQKANLSQHQLAKALGVSVHTLKSWEQGQRNPSGSARVLLDLLAKRPELIGKLTT
ncbi:MULTISPECIES: DNA-binding transcriptional regulator [Moraxella]|nr:MULTISPECIES: helix-turn-helix domain-containing protein [Moraxella]MBE9578383.1 helix-turn-helix domain-containing protein [Moraxella sp. K1664]MBE9587807.1 helix-turn-helix domain-containing protein [Moraxella sp. K1630]MBE9591069.1 helix-turn-helix domain-containing protein [Moraxella sp. K127]MBE9595962.1 helix-turn-helix domain-containing protein [Moraxella sp. K2450]MDH9218686.1 helix-turn-helix domain-containing protein [Moraxella lacunata]